MSAGATPGPWVFTQQSHAKEYADLTGQPLEAHDGFMRTNEGGWIVTHGDIDEDGGQLCIVTFKGSAKPRSAYSAPDPEGQANARLIAAAPKLLAVVQDGERLIAGDLTGIEWKRECRAFLEAARAALAKATTP